MNEGFSEKLPQEFILLNEENLTLDWSEKKVVVTGGDGFLGSKVVSVLKEKGVKKIIIPCSKDCDLRLRENCKKITKNIDVIFHLAAKVGGIGLNKAKPGELFYDNIMMGTQLMEEARINNVEKFIALGTICSYPKFTTLPFSEDSIWEGYPEETNAPYGLAKKMLLVQSQAYKQQYNFNSIVVFPTNLFGPEDNFDDKSSHVIPALIKKVFHAKITNQKEILLWGDGSPTRDFLYVDDAARGIVVAAEKYEHPSPLNLGTGVEISILDLANKIINLMGVSLNIKLESDKPNGQPRRCVSIDKAIKEIGFKPQISLEVGLQRTIDWYEKTQNKEKN